MSDLIKIPDVIRRKDAIDALMEILDRPNHAEFLYTDEICKTLSHLPSMQDEIAKAVAAVIEKPEIVRCENCRWRKDQSGSTAWLPCREIVTPSDFYCGRAERRTDE